MQNIEEDAIVGFQKLLALASYGEAMRRDLATKHLDYQTKKLHLKVLSKYDIFALSMSVSFANVTILSSDYEYAYVGPQISREHALEIQSSLSDGLFTVYWRERSTRYTPKCIQVDRRGPPPGHLQSAVQGFI